ncbi:major facilitator superfamily domain-containing protein 9-like isoform X2 [Acanthaster planci]|uniref:Major facilitator superfamily domain-containing protein 9-like isoform X2 n=1 Tax=Acanthaster planci TaxID=133434 RepID=A0A8B7XP16_ACAPL|nr:major facilitator superfamily domain-containing protein 9-like isoform X2 [Acanthaster planci]
MTEETPENNVVSESRDRKSDSKMMDHRHRIYLTSCLYLVGFLDLFGVSMLLPLLPHHARHLGASPVWIGAVGSVYGVLQLISGPFVGRLGDVIGRRQILLMCLLVSALGYSLNVFATSFAVLLVSRIPLGIFKHGMATVKAILTEVTPRRERPRVFGRFNAASNIGFIIGPLCGGYLSEYEGGFYCVAMCTTAIFFVNLLFVYLIVHPTGHAHLQRTESVASFMQDDYSCHTGANFFQAFKVIVRSSGDLLLLRFLLGISVMMFRDNFPLIMEEKFNTSARINGWLISYGALVSVFFGIIVGKIVTFYDDISKLLFHTTCLLMVNLFGLTFAPNLYFIVFFMTTLSITNPISRVCVTDLSVQRSDVRNAGTLLGISQSMASVSRSFSPILSGAMLEIGPNAPGMAGTVFAISAILLIVIIPPEKSLASEKYL